jgi:outer membrane protein assembly factor BamE (lipoprotein component of BamABCDE complex)
MRRPAALILFLVLLLFIVPNASPEPIYGRKELIQLVNGKTKKDVRALLGSPHSVATFEDDEGGLWRYGKGARQDWGFRWTVVDEDSGVPCWTVSIKFKNGNAISVSAYSCTQ